MLKKIFLFLTALPLVAQANVVITGTRIIYPAEQKNISIQLNNMGDSPALVQAWLDKGDIKSAPNATKVPFVIAPPLARVEGNAGQSLRVTFTGTENLPKDRESLFYFNLLDIPPKPSAESLAVNPNYLQMAIRSRLKFFYRPSELPLSVDNSYQKVAFSLDKDGIVVDNQTPYFITYQNIKVNNQKVKNANMVAPYSKVNYPFKGARAGDKLQWSVINDYGGYQSGEAVLR